MVRGARPCEKPCGSAWSRMRSVAESPRVGGGNLECRPVPNARRQYESIRDLRPVLEIRRCERAIFVLAVPIEVHNPAVANSERRRPLGPVVAGDRRCRRGPRTVGAIGKGEADVLLWRLLGLVLEKHYIALAVA